MICPRCGQENPDNAKNCSKCQVNIKYAIENRGTYEDRIRKEEEKNAKIESMFLTTTPSIEGKAIRNYLGLVTSSVVLGTGFLSTLDASLADFFGTTAELYKDKLEKANTIVLDELKEKAFVLGGNGVVGVNFNYTALMADKLMVCVSGSVVDFVDKEST